MVRINHLRRVVLIPTAMTSISDGMFVHSFLTSLQLILATAKIPTTQERTHNLNLIMNNLGITRNESWNKPTIS